MWIVPPFTQAGLVVYYAVVFILFDSFFTFIHVSYNALTPEMTRIMMSAARSTASAWSSPSRVRSGTIILATALGWVITDKRTLFAILGVGLGLIAMIPPLVVFKVTREKPAEELPPPLPWKTAIGATLSNRPFRLVMGLYLLSWTTASILAAVLIYYASYRLRIPDQANYFVLVAQGMAIAFIPFTVWLARRLDKRRAFDHRLVVVDRRAAPDCRARPEPDRAGLCAGRLVGLRHRDGVRDSVVDGRRRRRSGPGPNRATPRGFVLRVRVILSEAGNRVCAVGHGTGARAGRLSHADRDEQHAVQPAQAITAIRLFTGPIPAALLILAVLFAWQYPITREKHHALVEALQAHD